MKSMKKILASDERLNSVNANKIVHPSSITSEDLRVPKLPSCRRFLKFYLYLMFSFSPEYSDLSYLLTCFSSQPHIWVVQTFCHYTSPCNYLTVSFTCPHFYIFFLHMFPSCQYPSLSMLKYCKIILQRYSYIVLYTRASRFLRQNSGCTFFLQSYVDNILMSELIATAQLS